MLGDTTGDFIINALTGDLTSQPLDRELNDVHHLTVAAVDGGQPPLTSLTTVTVHVLDENDHCPQFQVRRYFR